MFVWVVLMSMVKFLGALAAGVALSVAAVGAASAAVIPFGNPGFPAVTVSPGMFVQAFYSDDSNTDVGNQSPANVLAVMQTWFGQSLTFGGGGSCGTSPNYTNGCTAFEVGGPNGKGGISTITAQLFGIHFGNRFIAFLFSGPVNGFEINGLRYGVSNIYAFNGEQNEIPVPGAVWLFASALAGLGLGRRRKAAI